MKAAVLAAAFLATTAPAEEALDLAALHRRAAESDPRVRQLALEAEESALRLENLEAEKRPAFALEGQAQYQSDVVRIPAAPVAGAASGGPPKETFDV
ncbi:MAG TPA: hypothetical protein VFM29_00495, partial [Vicinamibacteria bacterium]|nr:hypothetical protein [Vicinamibacteria bacterium]